MRYAEYLQMVDYGQYVVATLRNPWDTTRILHTYVLVPAGHEMPFHLPEGTVVRTPLAHSLVYSSVHCSLLDVLGAGDRIGGVCDLKYMLLPSVHQAVADGRVCDCGDAMNPDMERIITLDPDAVLLSPFENSGGYGRIEKLGIPLIECADYMETSAMGRAEWMRFYGLLFGISQQADSLFAVVDSSYQALKSRAGQAASACKVFTELKSGSAWYVPGGRSTVSGLLADAYGTYAFADDRHSGSVPLAFETVLDKAGDADVWLVKSERKWTYATMAADFAGYAGFKAYRQRNIYLCNTVEVPYYEETPFRPDLLLGDLIRIFHPELDEPGGLRYYRKLEE